MIFHESGVGVSVVVAWLLFTREKRIGLEKWE
jgi:hypothetical protein